MEGTSSERRRAEGERDEQQRRRFVESLHGSATLLMPSRRPTLEVLTCRCKASRLSCTRQDARWWMHPVDKTAQRCRRFHAGARHMVKKLRERTHLVLLVALVLAAVVEPLAIDFSVD